MYNRMCNSIRHTLYTCIHVRVIFKNYNVALHNLHSLDHVDQIIKTTAQASSGTDPSHSLSVRPNRQPPALSQSEKKLMLRQYGYASDEQTDEE